MTVLTLPSTGFKSDKVPLVDQVDADADAVAATAAGQQPPPPPSSSYDPKLLESGGLPDRRPDRCGRLACNGVRLLLALAASALVVWVSRENFRSMYEETATEMVLRRDDDGAAGASVPCKSYTSYAAAEDDMMSAMPAAPAAAVVRTAAADEAAYKKLEAVALQKQLAEDGLLGHGAHIIPADDFEISAPAVVPKSARYIHDFSVNVTGIVDVQGERCFVMPLVRNAVLPPVSLYDLLFKMSSGYYSVDMTKVIADMRVVKPAVRDLSDYGLYISKDCADYATFKLEKSVTVPADV